MSESISIPYSQTSPSVWDPRTRPIRFTLLSVSLLLWLLSISLLMLPDRSSLFDQDVWKTPSGSVYHASVMNDGVYITRRLPNSLFVSARRQIQLPLIVVPLSVLLLLSLLLLLAGRKKFGSPAYRN